MISCRSPHSSQPLCTEKAKQLIIRFLWIKQTFSGEPGSFLIYFYFFFPKRRPGELGLFLCRDLVELHWALNHFWPEWNQRREKILPSIEEAFKGRSGSKKKKTNKKKTKTEKKKTKKKKTTLGFFSCMKKRKTFHVNLWRWPQRGQQLPPCTVRPAGRGSTASEWMKENKIVSDLFKKSVKQITAW